MAYRFKKQYENHTLILADGTLIDKNTISRPAVQAKIKNQPSWLYMLEFSEEPKAEEPKAEEPKAEAPKKRTRKK